MPATIDPITRSVVQHRLSSIVAEMGEATLRTSYASRDQEVVFVNARVAAVGRVALREQARRSVASNAPCAPRSTRNAYFGAWRETPVYSLETLDPGHTIDDPAIVEAETTTVVINSGDRLTVNDLGWLDIVVRL